jgi:hypothetical protein
MRNLLFKNITSEDRRQKKLSSSELIEQEGLYTSINRHMVCRIMNVESQASILARPNLYVYRRRDTKLNLEEFYCRIKGQLYCANEDNIYLVSFINSLRIQLKRH